RFYVANRATAQRIADIVTQDLSPDRLLVEVNPGPGLLTEQILQRNVHNFRLYEADASFEAKLRAMNLPKDALRIADFNGLWRLSYLDGFDSGRRVLNLLADIAHRRWQDEINFRLFSVIGSVKFLRYLLNSITYQSEFYSLGRYEMILVMSPLLYSHIASTKDAGYKLYRGSTIVFQLYYDHELLGKVPRRHFLPWCNAGGTKKIRTLHQKLIEDGAEDWYLVRIVPRQNLYEHLLPDNLGLFASFVTQHYVSRRNRIIPSLEHWIPHCGARLILNTNYTCKSTKNSSAGVSQLLKSLPLSSNDYMDNMNIYTEFGELTPPQVLTLFNEFISWPEFHQSPFVQAVESQKLKQRLLRNLDDDDGSEESIELPDETKKQSTIESKQNARNRTPIYIPRRCAENEILYPGDHENDWVCDCKPTFIYHPDTHQCYQMWTRGYCETNTVLYLDPNEKSPKCIPNPCGDGLVQFRNMCVVLNQEHEQCLVLNIRHVVAIDEDTHQLDCVNISDVKLKHTTTKPQ
uniref:rRNA adenine N(6)-methyltransferase n=1 Tax=Anopheles dirus TaxID=7168 RepID=A0A182NRT5_9DIPT